MEVGQGVHRLTMGIVNWYLVEDGARMVLVDAGTPSDWSLLEQTLASLGRGIADIDAVLITHAHSDHTGFAERARSEAGTRVRIHKDDASVARGGKLGKTDGGMGRYLLHAEAYRTLVGLLRRGATRVIPIAEVSTLDDGEVLDVPGRPRVVHAPGHTPGSCALWFENRSALCTGDSLVTRNPLTGRVGPQIMPSGFNRDTTLALDSLTSLERLAAGVLLPGHGDPWIDGVSEAVRQARLAGPS